MNSKTAILLTAALLLTALLPWSPVAGNSVFAAPPVSFPAGSSQQEVLKLLGPPVEKQEFEVKREALWVYPKGRTISFKGETVQQDSLRRDLGLDAPEAMEATTMEALEELPQAEETINRKLSNNGELSIRKKKKKPLTFSGSDVFREIAKLKSEDDTPSTRSKKPTSNFAKNRKK